MNHAHRQLVAVGRSVGAVLLFDLFLRIAAHHVDGRALRERIVVANRSDPAREVDVVRVVHVAVADLALDDAAAERVVGADAQAVAVNKAVVTVFSSFFKEVLKASQRHAGTSTSAHEFHVVEPLAEGKELQAIAERVVAADRNGIAVIEILRIRAVAAVHRCVGNDNAFKSAALVTHSQRCITVGAGLAFNANFLLAVVLEGVLRIAREAGEGRRHIADGIVDARPARGGDHAGAEGFRVVRKERVDRAEEAVGAGRAAEDGHHAESERAVGRVEVDVRFAAEEVAALVERAVVGIEAVFKNEAHLVAVPEVFRALQTEAGAEFAAVFHRELVGGVMTGQVGVGVDVGEAEVDQAIDLNVSGRSGAGSKESAGERECEKSLFHFLSLYMGFEVRAGSVKSGAHEAF